MAPSHPAPLYVERTLDLPGLIAKKSHFLFGPRQTGKTFLIRHTLPGVRTYDLLDHATYLALGQRPARLGEELTPSDRVVVVDEIQRLPELLNEVHRLIEERGIRFLLTGSSARKLRRGGVNLLGGRARTRYLHPLTAQELGGRFDLPRAVQRGTLPSIYFSDDPLADLEAYAGSYLQQEIVAEVEVKAKETVSPQDVKSLRALAEERKLKRYLCVSLEPRPRRLDDVQFLPVREFLDALWAGEYV